MNAIVKKNKKEDMKRKTIPVMTTFHCEQGGIQS